MHRPSRGQTSSARSKSGLPAKQVHEAAEKHNAADDRRRDAGQEDRSCRDIKAAAQARLHRLIKTLEQELEGAIEKLCGKDQRDAPQQEAPLQGRAPEDDSGRNDERGKKEMNEKARMSAYAQFEPAQRIAEFMPPRAARPIPDQGFGRTGYFLGRRRPNGHHDLQSRPVGGGAAHG